MLNFLWSARYLVSSFCNFSRNHVFSHHFNLVTLRVGFFVCIWIKLHAHTGAYLSMLCKIKALEVSFHLIRNWGVGHGNLTKWIRLCCIFIHPAFIWLIRWFLEWQGWLPAGVVMLIIHYYLVFEILVLHVFLHLFDFSSPVYFPPLSKIFPFFKLSSKSIIYFFHFLSTRLAPGHCILLLLFSIVYKVFP